MGDSRASRIFAALERAFAWLNRRWQPLHNLWLAIRPARFSLLMVIAGLLFLFIGQGLDTLRDFAERTPRLAPPGWQQFFFLLGAFLWAYGSWYWARSLYYIRIPDLPEPTPLVNRVRKWLPRLIGFSAILGLAIAFGVAAEPYPLTSGGAGLRLRVYAFTALLGAVAFAVFVIKRRDLSRRLAQRHLATWLGNTLRAVESDEHLPGIYGTRQFADVWRAGWPLLAPTLVLAVLLFVLFAWSPELVAPALGATPILLLAAAGWIAFGSVADLLSLRYRFPVFTTLLILALVFSFWNDNHALRTVGHATAVTAPARMDVEDALRAWQQRQILRLRPPPGDRIPLFVVGAEGGGIRAAYWTASVLGEIQDRNPCFADQLFALSGVSGGSLGSAVFTALLAENHYTSPNFRCGDPAAPRLQPAARRILGADFLSPALAAMLYPDLFQRVWPVPIRHFDRARALERSWEQAWQKETGNRRFAQPLDQLWFDQQDHWLPALFLNATWVETGKRLIASNLQLTPQEFNDVEDIQQFYGARRLPLSTAVHLSARFTYVSPAGTLERDGEVHGRAVDGGYFENSGMTTALEIIQAVDQLKKAGPGTFWDKVDVYAILISNEPVNPKYAKQRLDSDKKSRGAQPTACCNEVWSPLRTLLATRGARGVYAQETVAGHVGRDRFIHFGLCKADSVKIPLGWVLSEAVRTEMNRQLTEDNCPAFGGQHPPLFDNPERVKQIDRLLRARYSQR